MAEDELNLEQLKLLKRVFDEADEDGSGELDIDEFVEELGPYLGENLTRNQLTQLFMKIDADAGGTVDWDEFTNYMFLQRAETQEGGALNNWKFFPQDFREKNDKSMHHRDLVDKIFHVEEVEKYITCARDGTFRVWNTTDLRHHKTIQNGTSWATDAVYAPKMRKLVISALDRSISYYDINRGSYELVGRVFSTGNMGVPQCMTCVQASDVEKVAYGDTRGNVVMLLNESRELPARDLIYTDDHQDYMYLSQDHTDWVTKLESIPDIGLVSSSLDSTIRIYDISRDRMLHTCHHHTRGVHSFAFSKAYSLFVSCGLERDIIVWQANTGRRMGELTGHAASVQDLIVDEHTNHVISRSVDHVIKVWDLRNNRCLQTIADTEWRSWEDRKVNAIAYDSTRRRLLTAVLKPYVWPHKLVTQDRTGHHDPVIGALYNSSFKVLVSVDEAGTVIVWNLEDGTREGRFFQAHGNSKVTAMTFDENERRLLTAANDGSIKMWNFNNGSQLRQYVHSEQALEINTLIFAADERRESDAVFAAGWNAKVFVWEDQDEDVCEDYRTIEGHKEDILHMAALSSRHLLATGDYEGRINIWNLHSGEKRMSLFHRAERYESAAERLQWICPPLRGSSDPALLLVSAGGDGMLRVWLISTVGRLLCTLPGAQGRLETVSAMCISADNTRLFIGDTSGHVRVWECVVLDTGSPELSRASFREISHWRAHEGSINSVALCDDIPNASGDMLIMAGSQDSRVTLWTMSGCLVGVFGEHSWTPEDPHTWQDPTGERRVPPMDVNRDTYYAALLHEELQSAFQKQEAEEHRESGTQIARRVLQEHKHKIRENVIKRPDQVHCNLRLHPPDAIPQDVTEMLSSTMLTKRTRGKAAKSTASKGKSPGVRR